jgi:hypothetical protein
MASPKVAELVWHTFEPSKLKIACQMVEAEVQEFFHAGE